MMIKRALLLIALCLCSLAPADLVRPILPGKTYRPIDLYPVYRDGSTNIAGIVRFRATLSGYINLKYTFSGGTVDVYLDGVYQESLVSGVESNISVTAGQRVDLVFSDPASVTYFEQTGATLQGDETQFTQFQNLSEYYYTGQTYGISWDESADTYARTEALLGESTSQTLEDAKLPAQVALKRCVLSDAGEVQYYLDADDSTLKADGVTASDLTGGDGQVMVEIPAFYYKYGYASTTHTWEISLTPQSGFSLHPAFVKNGSAVAYRYIGAYEGVGWDDSASDYIDSGNVAATGWSGTTIDTSNDKLSSVSGKCPVTDETRAEFRAIAANRGTGWRLQDYDLISAIQLLYLIEYADWNSQAMIGQGRTQLSGGTWVKDSYIGVTGKSNGDGNGTNSVSGNTNDAYMTYRGVENFFGNVWKWVDGININDNVPYVSNTDTDFADDTIANYTNLGGTLANANGYQKTLLQQGRGFLPASVGGASNTYITDYYYQNSGWRVVALGGNAYGGARAGFAALAAYYSSGVDYAALGSRLCF